MGQNDSLIVALQTPLYAGGVTTRRWRVRMSGVCMNNARGAGSHDWWRGNSREITLGAKLDSRFFQFAPLLTRHLFPPDERTVNKVGRDEPITSQSEEGTCVLTLSPQAVKTQCLSQCQAFQRLVRSSHSLVNWILKNFWSAESIFNQFSVFLKTLNAICVCLQYKHPRSMKRVIRTDKPTTSIVPVKSQKCDFGAEPMSCHQDREKEQPDDKTSLPT
jgi:hypothetical protein